MVPFTARLKMFQTWAGTERDLEPVSKMDVNGEHIMMIIMMMMNSGDLTVQWCRK